MTYLLSYSSTVQEQQTHQFSPAAKSALQRQYSQLSVFWITPAVPTPACGSALEPVCLQTAARVWLSTEAQPAESLWLSEHPKLSLQDKRSCTAMVRKQGNRLLVKQSGQKRGMSFNSDSGLASQLANWNVNSDQFPERLCYNPRHIGPCPPEAYPPSDRRDWV